MDKHPPLAPDRLRRCCDPATLNFTTTAELPDLDEIVGQTRAVDAMQFGLAIQREGYNLFALGPPGTGKHMALRRQIGSRAATEPAPEDWCYVNNFEQPERPRTLRLPTGSGLILRRDVEKLLDDLRAAIPAVFESEDYRTRKQVIEEEIKERQQRAFETVRQEAEAKSIALLRTPTGFIFAPLKDGEVLSHDDFSKLPEPEQRAITGEMEVMQDRLQAVLQQMPLWEREGRERLRALNREVTTYAVGHSIEDLRRKYAALAEVVNYLNAMQQDIIENAHEFLGTHDGPASPFAAIATPPALRGSPFFRRYLVNALVNHVEGAGAPVIYEDHPTFQNLIGQLEHISHMGALVTDFNLIRAGALHKANGGYLLLDAHRVLMQPYAWEGLKRALRAGEIRIESLGQMLGLI